MHPVDTLGRPIRDLRISVTDRCNFRCAYCMPKTVFGQDYRFMDRKELLTFEELERVARVFAGLGVEKIRLTGGEPLLRKELESLVERLATIDGLELTLTTNASLKRRPSHGWPGIGPDHSERQTGVSYPPQVRPGVPGPTTDAVWSKRIDAM